jgi:hypothetical protein
MSIMEKAIKLLNEILAESRPLETISLPLHQANMIGRLGKRELGCLTQIISSRGIVRALEEEGLFSRKVVISFETAGNFAVLSVG